MLQSCSESTKPIEIEEIVVTYSGSMSASNTSDTNRIGLFNTETPETVIKDEDSEPLTITKVSGQNWSINMPDLSKNPNFSNSETIYWFKLLGWSDNDGDGKYDPISGEASGYVHFGPDSLKTTKRFWYVNDLTRPFNERWTSYDTTNLFILDHAEIKPISSWTILDSTYNIISGIAEIRTPFILDSSLLGITIWLSEQEIDCSHSPIRTSDSLSLMALWMPEFTERAYDISEVTGLISGRNRGAIVGGPGTGGLVLVDTLHEKRVEGWFEYKDINDLSDYDIKVRAYGLFDVPFCLGNL